MQILMAAWDGGGTVPVEVGVARRLLERGHEVRVLADPTLREAVEAVGAAYLPWQQAPARQSADLADDIIKDWECRTSLGQFARVRDRIIIGPSAAYAADVKAALLKQHTDVLVADGALLGALVGAEAVGVPAVALCPNVYLRPAPGLPPFGLGLKPARNAFGRLRDRALTTLLLRVWRTSLPTFNATRASMGLAPLDDPFGQWDRCAAVAVLTARAFDFPAELPRNVHYAGPILDDPIWAGPEVSAPEGAPLVVVGLSSTYIKGQADLLRRIVVALDSLEVVALVTTGPTIDPAEVPGTPRVQVVRSAPHSQLFHRAALAITHAGHGTVIKALAADVPVLGIPQGRDQADNMARVTARGAGAVLRSSVSAARIAATARTLLEDPGYRKRAAQLGSAIRSEADSSHLCDVVEAASRPGPTGS